MTSTQQPATVDDIRSHYDVGNRFFQLWLDPTMAYSCALFAPDAGLDGAQIAKLDHHLDTALPAGPGRLLDVGCGWGSLLRRAVSNHAVPEAVGLTLSAAQAAWIAEDPDPRLTILVQDWRDYEPDTPFDGIVSIGALEHFVGPETPAADRVATYREFFQKCATWLVPGGRLSLQTMAYGNGAFVSGALSDIFPNSDLPRLTQLAEAMDGVLEPLTILNHGDDYAETCRHWLSRLRARRDEAIALVGEPEVDRFDRFLRAGVRGYEARVFQLLRLELRRLEPTRLR